MCPLHNVFGEGNHFLFIRCRLEPELNPLGVFGSVSAAQSWVYLWCPKPPPPSPLHTYCSLNGLIEIQTRGLPSN